ncbi:hypothetical protein SLEP1_g23311 [Rubroshorea leprosula]|uniref:Uncharacterized protein n=1 Tax=Rubroshorea leprosula TaxID=152421 RepID=A0AAV5JMX1_9ROSI|nr:hypothetical protein SLEP1_g23311 [Rubroshorea leprosula]
MEKFVQDLKKRFLNLVEAITSRKIADMGNAGAGGEESKSESMEIIDQKESVEVQERVIQIRATKGATRPGVPKGPPAKTG